MAARSIDEVNFGALTATGQQVRIPEYTMTVQVKWTRPDGTQGDASRVLTFPGLLSNMPAHVREEYMREMLTRTARVLAGAEDWPEVP